MERVVSEDEGAGTEQSLAASMLGKFNPWMIPMFWMMGGGGLTAGGMSFMPHNQQTQPPACPDCIECQQSDEADEYVPRRRQELINELEQLEAELEKSRATNDALLSQLTTLSTSCSE